MADYNKNYMAAYKQYGESMIAGGGGTNLSGTGSSTMQVWNYGNDDQPSGLGAPTTKPKEEKKSENFWDRITNLFTSNDVDVTSVYTPSVNPASVYNSDAFNPAQVEDYVYRADMSEQTQDMVEQAMGFEKTKLGQLQLLDTRAMSEEEKERLGPLLDLADDIRNQNITTTELPPIEGEQQSSLMDALMEGQPTAGLMQRPSVFTGQEVQIASTLPDWMEALPLEGFSQALIDIREGRIDRETGQPIVQEEEVDLSPPEAADQELIPTNTAGPDVAPEIDTAPPEQTGLMSRRMDGKDGDLRESFDNMEMDAYLDEFIPEIAELEGMGGDDVLGDLEPTYSYGITEAKANEYGMQPQDYETMEDFARDFAARYRQEKQDMYPEIFTTDLDKEVERGLQSYLWNRGSFYPGQLRELRAGNLNGFINELKDVISARDRQVGRTLPMSGLSKRRAAEANLVGRGIEGYTPIAEVETTGTPQRPVFIWRDAQGNELYRYAPQRPLHSQSTVGTLEVPM